MASNEEIQRIQLWVADLHGVGVKDCPLSREDVRKICRGPMKDLLLDFLVPRFRTEEQIKVIRSNLFLAGVDQNGDEGQDSPIEKEIQEAKKRLKEVKEETEAEVKKISEGFAKVGESKQNVEIGMLDLESKYGNSEFSSKIIKDRVDSTGALLYDVNNAKFFLGPHRLASTEPNTDQGSGSVLAETEMMHFAQLNSLYNNASDLFDVHFISNSSGSQDLSPETQDLTSTVAIQTLELAQSGLAPRTLERWVRQEQEKSREQIRNLNQRFSNVMNPLEELQNEAEALKRKLLRVHVDLGIKNKERAVKTEELHKQIIQRIPEVIQANPKIVPTDLILQVRNGELEKKLSKCREISKQLNQIESLGHRDGEADLLALLCESKEVGGSQDTGDSSGNRRTSLNSSGDLVSSTKPENLEGVTYSLMKVFPADANQLESTINQSKTFVLDKLPKMLSKQTNDDKRSTKPPQSPTYNIKVPPQFVANSELIKPPAALNQTQDDLLEKLFIAQKELEARRVQSAKIIEEKGTFAHPED